MKNKIFAAAVISAASLAMAQVPSYTNYATGSIDFGGVKSGNYVLKVNGTTELVNLK